MRMHSVIAVCFSSVIRTSHAFRRGLSNTTSQPEPGLSLPCLCTYVHVHTCTYNSNDSVGRPTHPLLGLPGLLGRPVFHFSLPFFIVPYSDRRASPSPVHTRLAYRPTFSDSTRLQTADHRPQTTDYRLHTFDTRYPVSTFTFTLAAVVSFRFVSSRFVSFRFASSRSTTCRTPSLQQRISSSMA